MSGRRFLAAAAIAFVPALGTSCRTPLLVPPPLPVRITVLGINDFHGAVDERRVLLHTSGGSTAQVRVGGAPLLYAYVQKLRNGNPDGTVLVNAGDFWLGSLESNFFEGNPVVEFDNRMGYDAAALGNEFDFGPLGPVSLAVRDDPAERRFGALEARRKQMKFPVLAANVRATEPGAPVFKPWVMLQRKGVKIAVIGLASEDTPNSTQAPNIAGLVFDPPAPALVAAAKDARAKGADVVIAAGHFGGDCTRGTAPDDPDACRKDTEIVRVLSAVPPGTVDVFVAGRTHQFIAHRIHGTPVIESGAHGQAIGRVELIYDPAAEKITRTTIHPPQLVCRDVLADTGSCEQPAHPERVRPVVVPAAFQGGPIGPDTEVELLLAPFYQEVAEMKSEKLAVAERPLRIAKDEPSEAGALVTDEMRAATRRLADVPDADFALQNAGGIRTGLPAGEIRYGHVYETLPFDNALATAKLTGAQLHALLTTVLGTGRIFQTSGLLVELRCEAGKTVPTSLALFDQATGAPLDPRKTYTIVWNDFLANGGDGTKEHLGSFEVSFHSHHLLRDVVAEGLRHRKTPLNSAKEPLLDPKRPRQKRKGCKP